MNRVGIEVAPRRGFDVCGVIAKSFGLLMIVVLLGSAYGQEGSPKVSQLLDAVVAKAKETSLYSSSVNWDLLEKRIYSEAATAATVDDLKPAFEVLLNGLRDHHGRVLGQTDFRTLAHFTDGNNRCFFD